jgi:hypothetical protein
MAMRRRQITPRFLGVHGFCAMDRRCTDGLPCMARRTRTCCDRIAESIRIHSYLPYRGLSLRLFGGRKQQSIMLLTILLVIAAGMLVNHVHPEYRKWRSPRDER